MYSIGQIFNENELPQDLAEFCNDSQETDSPCFIQEIESVNGVRRFQIVANEEPTESEIAKIRIAELQSYLSSTDWYAIRFAETGVEIPSDVRERRQMARDEISRWRNTL